MWMHHTANIHSLGILQNNIFLKNHRKKISQMKNKTCLLCMDQLKSILEEERRLKITE